MEKKYIIELPENTHWIQWIMEGTKDHHPYTDFKQVEDLTPYTEPDLEQVREEAYEDGYKTAKVQCNIQAEKDLREVGERHYQKGLSDAWEAARNVVALSTVDRREVFGSEYMYSILEKHTAAEAIEKIRQYEQEKEEIKVGDEVNAPFGKAIVVNIDSVAEKIWLVYADGHGGFEYFKDAPTKTGRRFPEIAEVLRKMREE